MFQVRASNEAEVGVEFLTRGYSQHEYLVRLLDGDWPEDTELLRICDLCGAPFGGHVEAIGPGCRRAVVYVD